MSQVSDKKVEYIKKIIIKGLWGDTDIEWDLNRDVNVLKGINGSGKSTILNMIDGIINEKTSYHDLREIKIIFNDKLFINLKNTDDIKEFISFYEDILEISKERLIKDSKKLIKILMPLVFTNIVNKKPYDEIFLRLSRKINLIKISTFDMEIDKKKKRISNCNSKTELDFLLCDLINEFKSYQLTLSKLEKRESQKLEDEINILSAKDNATHEELKALRELLNSKKSKTEEIYKRKNAFLEIVNKLFKETSKEIDFDENNSIIFNKGEKIISLYKLSAGEKQILIILLTVILQEDKPLILLMDEPEISLHLNWQESFIENLQKLNPNLQIIIATHSPAIIQNGWGDKLIDMQDIIKK